MTDPTPRPFADAAAIRSIGLRLLACTLPKAEWTHEAHLAACLWLVVERRDIDLDADLRGIITRYNERVGGVNDDAQGYHHSITCAYLAGVRVFVAERFQLFRHLSVRAELVEVRPEPSMCTASASRGTHFDKLSANETDLAETVNALLSSDMGHRDWPLRFWSRERLFSVAARRDFVPPDLADLPVAC